MMDWIIGLLVAKWWIDKEEKKKVQLEFSGNIDFNEIQYGYVRNGETIKDLQ